MDGSMELLARIGTEEPWAYRLIGLLMDQVSVDSFDSVRSKCRSQLTDRFDYSKYQRPKMGIQRWSKDGPLWMNGANRQ